MNGSWAIFQHEVKTRWTVLVAAAFATLIPLVVPVLPGVFSASAADIRGALAWGVALGLSWLMAVVFGATMIASELSQGRASFLLSRPVSTPAIWLGKLGASLFVVVFCELLVLLPAAVLPGREGYFDFSGEPWWSMPLILVGLPLFLILATHALSIMFRDRSSWLAVDAAALLIVVFAAWSLFWSWTPETIELSLAGLAVLVAALALFLFLGGGAQVIWGRGDLRRSHRVLSTVLWSGTLATVAVLAGISSWIRAVPPSQMNWIHMVTAGGEGPWLAISGTSARCRWHEPAFLFNMETGHWQSIRLGYQYRGVDLEFSDSGTRALWASPVGGEELELMVAELGPDSVTERETGLIFPVWSHFALSGDGTRVAVASGSTLSVYELQDGALVAAVKLEGQYMVQRILFSDSEHVRVARYRGLRGEVRGAILQEFALPGRTLRPLLELGDEYDWSYPRWSPTLDRMLVATGDLSEARQWHLRQVARPDEVVLLGEHHRFSSTAFLSQGRVALAERKGGRALVSLFDAGGQLLRQVDLGTFGRVRLGLEVEPGRLVVGLKEKEDPLYSVAGFQSMILNLESGELEGLSELGCPVASSMGFAGEHHPDALAGRLFFADSTTLQLWDPEQGVVKTVLDSSG